MRRLWIGILLVLITFVTPVFSWEFTTKGEFEYRYTYLGRANGYQDLFGDMRFQDSALNTTGMATGFAGPNYWRGYNGQTYGTNPGGVATPTPMMTGSAGTQVRIVRGGISYADADGSAVDQRMTFEPELRINNALRARGVLDLNSLRQKYNHRDFETNGPLDRWYQHRTSANAFDTAMKPTFSQWNFTAQLPWAIIRGGNRGFGWGTGSNFALNTVNEALTIFVPYGPFRFFALAWTALNPSGYGSFTPYGQTVGANPTGPPANSVVNCDSGEHFPVYWASGAIYQNGPIDLGAAIIQRLLHIGQANLTGNGLVGLRPLFLNPASSGPTAVYGYGNADQAGVAYTMYLKYNDGRFFANAEYWFGTLDNTFEGQLQGAYAALTTRNGGAPPQYQEAASAFLETGTLSGPAKFALMFAWAGGPVLNNSNPTKLYNSLPINYQATDPYNYLMFHTYGGGNDAPWNAGIAFTIDENGMMSDAYALAARLDYAIAANLNLWGSYMWASRVEKNGWLAGSKNYSGTPSVSAGNALGIWTAADASAWKLAMIPGAGGDMNPYVDDGYLGWEVNFGADWKLLEDMTVRSRYAFWQPGPWFDQAYGVVGMSGGTAYPNAARGVGSAGAFMQGRSAIQCFTTSIMIDF